MKRRFGWALLFLVGCGPAFTAVETEEEPEQKVVIVDGCGDFVPPPAPTVVYGRVGFPADAGTDHSVKGTPR